MRQRCYNKNYKKFHLWGGKGIIICEEWSDYVSFEKWSLHNGYEDTLTIDRIDSNGNYEPNNCRWSTSEEQANNTKSVKLISYNGEQMSYSRWERRLGLSRGLISERIKRGWTEEQALSIYHKLK